MGNDLRRRVKALEHQRNFAPMITADEIDQAVARYEVERCGHDDHTPPSSAFRTMLHAMTPSLARVFLTAHPQDLML